MSCDAVDPVPRTATRLPVRSTEWSHRDECITVPVNGSCSTKSGNTGWVNNPTAETTTLNSGHSPAVVVSCHRGARSTPRAQRISVPSRRCGRKPCSSTQRSKYFRISGCGDHSRDQCGFKLNEYEYRCDLTSHASPG